MASSSPQNAERQVGLLAVIGVSARVGAQSMALILLVAAGRFLTVEIFGIFVLASILMTFAQTQLYTGIYHYVLREPGFEQTKQSAFSLQIIFSIALSLLIALGALISHIAGWGDLLSMLILSTAFVPILGMIGSWHEAIVLRNGNVSHYYASLFTSEFIGFCLGMYMLVTDQGVWALIANRYAAAFIFPLVLRLKSSALPRPGWQSQEVRSIISYSLGMYGNAMLAYLSAYGAAIVIGGFLSPAAVGLFRMASRTAGAAFDIFAQTFRTFAWQALGRLAREERSDAATWIRLLAVFLSITIFTLGSLSILANDTTSVLLGEKWMGMVPPLQIICWVTMIGAASQLAAAHLGAAGRTGFLFKTRILEAVVLLIGLAITVPFGMTAITYSLFVPVTLFVIIAYREMIRITKTSLFEVVKGVLPGIAGSLSALIVVFASTKLLGDQTAWVRICFTAFAGLSAFLLIAFIPLARWTQTTLKIVSTAILPRQADSN